MLAFMVVRCFLAHGRRRLEHAALNALATISLDRECHSREAIAGDRHETRYDARERIRECADRSSRRNDNLY